MVRQFLRNLVGGPAAAQLQRFVAVGTTAAGLQMLLLWLFVDYVGWNYLVGATVAIETTIIFQYILNNAWTFQANQNTGLSGYLYGLLKTNLVRGSAIPIQLGVLFALVEWASVQYLLANVVAIGISGIYRYVLDTKWTWGGDVL